MHDSAIEAVVIHAVYLINGASDEPEVRRKSLASLAHALMIGDGIGAAGVVVHPGSGKGEPHGPTMKRAGKASGKRWRNQTAARCCSRTRPAPGAARAATSTSCRADRRRGGGERLGRVPGLVPPARVGLRGAHRRAFAAVVDEFDAKRRARAASLHARERLQGAARLEPRPARQPRRGRARRRGLRVFLSEPRFEDLPVLLEMPGPDGQGPDRTRSGSRSACGEQG